MLLRVTAAAARLQLRLIRRNIETLSPIVTMPLSAVISLAILASSGREDLASYALVAALLMSIGQMGVFTGSEILSNERHGRVLEAIVATPASYFSVLIARIVVVTAVGIAGFVESWLIARLLFGIHVAVHFPAVFAATLALTIFAASATSLITSALFCFGRTTRTYQNAISGPLYLLSGVLVPVAFLPPFIQPVSQVIFLFWSAELLRDALRPAPPQDVGYRLAAILILGLIAGIVGMKLVDRLLNHLRREGTLGLS